MFGCEWVVCRSEALGHVQPSACWSAAWFAESSESIAVHSAQGTGRAHSRKLRSRRFSNRPSRGERRAS